MSISRYSKFTVSLNFTRFYCEGETFQHFKKIKDCKNENNSENLRLGYFEN